MTTPLGPNPRGSRREAWMKDVEIVGDSFDGPHLVLKDGTVVTYELPEN